MTPLRHQLIQELTLRGYSPRTQEAYVGAIYGLAKFYHRSPDQLLGQELRDYLEHLITEKALSASSLNQKISAMRFFYTEVLDWPAEEMCKTVPRRKPQTRRPQVYSIGEIKRFFEVGCSNRKYRALFMTMYGAGLRLQEVCHLQVGHIDRARGQIRVVQGKGQKDRYVSLSGKLHEELRSYLSRYTHRVAITQSRLVDLDREQGTVSFRYKDYADGRKEKVLPLSLREFVRRLCLHFLPERFVKIRHYGLLANRRRQQRLEKVRAAMGVTPQPPTEPAPESDQTEEKETALICPYCQTRTLELIEVLPAEPQPEPELADTS